MPYVILTDAVRLLHTKGPPQKRIKGQTSASPAASLFTCPEYSRKREREREREKEREKQIPSKIEFPCKILSFLVRLKPPPLFPTPSYANSQYFTLTFHPFYWQKFASICTDEKARDPSSIPEPEWKCFTSTSRSRCNKGPEKKVTEPYCQNSSSKLMDRKDNPIPLNWQFNSTSFSTLENNCVTEPTLNSELAFIFHSARMFSLQNQIYFTSTWVQKEKNSLLNVQEHSRWITNWIWERERSFFHLVSVWSYYHH